MEALADHLGVCTACAAAFDGLEDDGVVSKLRQYLPGRTPALDPECERLAAAARMIPLEPTGADTSLRETPSYGPRTPAVPPPRRFAGYDLLEQLGTGGMGVVWKARHLRLNRLVALKLVRFASAADGPEREHFRREGEAVARLRHPNIVEIYDADEEENQPYIAMELLEAGTLARRVRDRLADGSRDGRTGADTGAGGAGRARQGRGPPRPQADQRAVRRRRHAQGDGLRPGQAAGRRDGAHRAGDVLGTPSYMAPEQAQGEAAPDRPAPPTCTAWAPSSTSCSTAGPPSEAPTGRRPWTRSSTADSRRQPRKSTRRRRAWRRSAASVWRRSRATAIPRRRR